MENIKGGKKCCINRFIILFDKCPFFFVEKTKFKIELIKKKFLRLFALKNEKIKRKNTKNMKPNLCFFQFC